MADLIIVYAVAVVFAVYALVVAVNPAAARPVIAASASLSWSSFLLCLAVAAWLRRRAEKPKDQAVPVEAAHATAAALPPTVLMGGGFGNTPYGGAPFGG